MLRSNGCINLHHIAQLHKQFKSASNIYRNIGRVSTVLWTFQNLLILNTLQWKEHNILIIYKIKLKCCILFKFLNGLNALPNI